MPSAGMPPASAPLPKTPVPPAGSPTAGSGPLPLWLWGAVMSLLASTALLAGVHVFIDRQIQLHMQRFNTYPLPEKWTGLALQHQAFTDPALLPVYGSSELAEPQTNRADDFFRAHPTGFGAFLIGNPGETCLMIATKLAAAAPADVRGKKAVVFVSPGWFIAPELDHPGFGVNFSPLHGGVLTFESRLSPALKQDIARRLLDYQDILTKYPLLKAGLTCLAANTGAQRALLALLTPLAAFHDGVQRELDYARLGLWWWREGTRVTPRLTAPDRPVRIDWDARLRDATAVYDRQPLLSPYCVAARSAFDDQRLNVFTDPRQPAFSADENFSRWCARSKEWTDYRLMLRTAQEMGISMLVVCQPINARYNQLQGVSAGVRANFYRRLNAETASFHVPLLTFPTQGDDPHYFQDANHPSALMWLVYDRALDAFYHQPPASKP